ncbi:hypothetical protein [Streptomyces goshikiensis]|uniref:hypothetical protein n=1 Tax=Streptomyces goshikiensis TaxID=1942 RepID=UPI0036A82DF0
MAVAGDVTGGHLAWVEDAVDGDQGGEAVLVGRRPPGEYAAHAAPEERDAAVVDLGQRFDEVHDRGDDVLPVRAEDGVLVVAGAGLPGAVEGQDGVPAFRGGQRAAEVALLAGIRRGR